MESSAIPSFEQQWKSAFQGAEASLPSNAWSAIEHTLTRMENESNRRNVVYYQRLAAALLILAIASASLFLWQWTNVQEIQTAAINSTGSVSEQGTKTITPEARQDLKPSGPVSYQQKKTIPTKNQTGLTKTSVPQTINKEESLIIPEKEPEQIAMANEEMVVQGNVNEEIKKPLTEEEEKELVKKLLGEDETIIPEKKKSFNPSLWGAVGISGGSYSPYSTSSPTATMALALPNASNIAGQSSASASKSIGTAYSFGVMMGKQVTKHWVLQAGITYRKQNVDYESNVAASSANGLTAFDANAAHTGGNYVITNPYTLNSMTEYLSLPIQAGYVLIDRKFGLAVNSGVSTDLFLRNTLTDKSGTYYDASQSAGASSAYRTISWSGVTNTELSMRLNGNFKFSIVPGIRYSFSNIMNENSGYQQPFILDLGFRCRYIFK